MDSFSRSTVKTWYLIYTKPGQEMVALTNLERQGYQVYLPRMRHMRKRQGRLMDSIEPLFPRYLFIQLDTHTDNWGPIRSTLGVASMVRFGQAPARVPDKLVEFLRQKAGNDGLHAWAVPDYHNGDRIRVTEGVFKGYEGILLARTSRERVVLLLDSLERKVRTQAAINQIEHS